MQNQKRSEIANAKFFKSLNEDIGKFLKILTTLIFQEQRIL